MTFLAVSILLLVLASTIMHVLVFVEVARLAEAYEAAQEDSCTSCSHGFEGKIKC